MSEKYIDRININGQVYKLHCAPMCCTKQKGNTEMIEEFKEKIKERYLALDAEYEKRGRPMSWDFRNGYMYAKADAIDILIELLEGTETNTETTVDNGVTW